MGWGQQEIRSFRELVDAGCTDEQIAEEMSLSLGAISTLRRKAFPAVLQPNQHVAALPVRHKGGAPSDWTDRRVDRLTELYGKGWTALQIAEDLGGITRNAVIGKIHRLGLERGTVIRKKEPAAPRPPAPEKPVKVRVAKPKPTPAEEKEASDFRALPYEVRNQKAFTKLNPEGGEGVLLLDLKVGHCRWPMGDLMETSHRFCGISKDLGEVYCKHHRMMAYVPPPARRAAYAHNEAPRR